MSRPLLVLPLLASFFAGCATGPDPGVNPLSGRALSGRDTILLDTLIYYRDTLVFHPNNIVRSGGGEGSVFWQLCEPCDTISHTTGFTFTPKSPADTLFKEAHGFVNYQNGEVDTYRVLISVRAGRPTVEVSPAGPLAIVDLDSNMLLLANAADENGTITRYYWDSGGGSGLTDRGLFNTLSLNFFLPDKRLIRVAVRDEDSLLSNPDSVWIEARPLHQDTMIYVYDSLRLSLTPAAGKILSAIRWIDWPGDTVGTAKDLIYTNRTAADTGRRVLVGFASYTDLTADTHRTIVHINSALPELSLNLHSGLAAGVYYSGIPYLISAQAADVNGSVTALEWDTNEDGAFEMAGADTFKQVVWKFPGPHTVRARASDDDGFWSPAESLTVNLTPPSGPTLYYLDTLKLALIPDPLKTSISVLWREWLGDTLGTQALVFRPLQSVIDTGWRLYHGIVTYSDSSSDTTRTLVELRSGLPRLFSFYLSAYFGTDTICCADSTGFSAVFRAQAGDDNGVVKGFEWDLDGDGLFETAQPDSGGQGLDSATVLFTQSGDHTVRVRAWDDDSLFSAPDTLWFFLKP